MSQPTARASGRSWLERLSTPGASPSLASVLGVVALVPLGGLTLFRLARNTPAGVPGVVESTVPTLTTLAAVVPPLCFLPLALVTDRLASRVAFAALAVFPLVAVVNDAAWIPAAGVTVVAGVIAVGLELRARADFGEGDDDGGPVAVPGLGQVTLRPALVAVPALVGLTLSLAGAAGVETSTLLPWGATVAFVAMAALPLARSVDGAGAGVWLFVTAGAVWWASAAPFVAGAVALVAFGAGQVPFVLLAVGIGGALAAAVTGARRRAAGPAVAAALVLAAGVPGRLPRAVALAFALVLLVREWDAGRVPTDAGHGSADSDAAPAAPSGGNADA